MFLTLIQTLSDFSWFLSHKQSTGQSVVLPLHLALKEYGETSFLDICAEFDVHNLEVLVEKTEFFLFLLSEDIFLSEYCKKGIKY